MLFTIDEVMEVEFGSLVKAEQQFGWCDKVIVDLFELFEEKWDLVSCDHFTISEVLGLIIFVGKPL